MTFIRNPHPVLNFAEFFVFQIEYHFMIVRSFFSEWEPLGCYKDSRDRAMPHYFKTVVTEDYKHLFEECRKEAERLGYDYFGVQYWKECWGSNDAYKTYDKHGCQNNCKVQGNYGIGTHWSNFIYQLKSGMNEKMIFSNLSQNMRSQGYTMNLLVLMYKIIPLILNRTLKKTVALEFSLNTQLLRTNILF